MHTFEITIQRKSGDSWPVVVEQSTSAVLLPVRNEGVLSLDLTELRTQATPGDYGTVLGKALFQDAVRDAFVQALTKSEDRLCVLLFVEADDLKTLRWERLCAPLDRGWDFLALTQRAPLSMYLPSLTDRRFPPFGRRNLRALALVASPEGLERYRLQPFEVNTAVSSLRAALGEIPCDVLARVDGAVGPPTLDALCERMTAAPYTLLHIVCHGQLLRGNGETALYLANADQGVDRVDGTRLLGRLGRLRGAGGLPHFAFLATCESASPEAEGALGGVAQRLVRELGMPAVVAMTEKVSLVTAQALWENFYQRLREHGEVDRALVEASVVLAEQYDITVPALYSRLGGRPLFSDTLDRPLTNEEIRVGLARLEQLLAERAPVLQQAFNAPAMGVRGTLDADAAALSVAARQEREQALAEVNKLCGEALDLSFAALALGQEPPAYDGRCPFRGLYPFRAEDQEFFFGREPLIAGLQQKLTEHNFLAILGPSGSGKSSLVLAGLIPALQRKDRGLHMAYLTPGSDPLGQLAASLSKVQDQSAVLVVDQFEELFTLCADETNRQAFLGSLLALPKTMRVVLTMRADFWGECAPYRELKGLMQTHQELIPPMDASELRRAMELQAGKVGLRFEADLSHTLLEDVQGEPGAMPLLQHALLELWQRRHGRWLRAEEYRAIGGVQQAIARTANDVYETLSPDEQDRVRDIFVRLTRLDEEAIAGEAGRDTRRRVWMGELVPVGSDPAPTMALVKRLADAQLVVTSRNEATGREEVEVAHEALIRHWPRLHAWLNEDRLSLRVREGIRQAALDWESNNRNESLLVHRGSRLDEAAALSSHPRFVLNTLERIYVDACVALREREQAEAEEQRQREVLAARRLAEEAEARRQAEEQARREAEQRADDQAKATRRLRRRAFVLLMMLMLAVAAVGFAWHQRNAAEQQRNVAEHQRQIGFSRELATSATSQLPIDPERSLLLAVEAAKVFPTAQAEQALRQSLLESRVRAVMSVPAHPFSYAAFSPDGKWVITASGDGTARLWNIGARKSGPALNGNIDVIHRDPFSFDSRLVVTASRDGTAQVWDVSTGSRVAVLRGHTDQVLSVAFSPDAKLVVTASIDGTARIWEISPERSIELRGHSNWVTSAAFSPDGKIVVTTGGCEHGKECSDTSVRKWNARTGQGLAIWQGHTSSVVGTEFSPDGRFIITWGQYGDARVWDPDGEQSITALNSITSHLTSASFSPDSKFLVTGSSNNQATVWNTDSWQNELTLAGHTDSVTNAIFSHDARLILTSSNDHTARVWEAATGKTIAELRGHSGALDEAAFSLDDKFVFTAGRCVSTGDCDSTVRVWEIEPDRSIAKLHGHAGSVLSTVFNPEGTLVVTASADGTARVWEVPTGKIAAELRGHTDEVRSAAFSADGKLVVTGSLDNTARVWEAGTGRTVVGLRGHKGPVLSAAFSPEGTFVVTASADKSARVWEAATAKVTAELLGHASSLRGAEFRFDGKFVVTASTDKTARLWEVGTWQSIVLDGHKWFVNSAAYSPDGEWVVTASQDGNARVWDGSTGRSVVELEGHTGAVFSAAFSPNSKFVVTASDDRTARVWEAGTWGSSELRGHLGRVFGAAFSPTSEFIVTASDDRTARVWETSTGKALVILSGHTDWVNKASFSPDGKLIVTASKDGTAQIWSCEVCGSLDQLLDLARRRATRELTTKEREKYLHESRSK